MSPCQPLREALSAAELATKERDNLEKFLEEKSKLHSAGEMDFTDEAFTRLKTLQSGDGRSVHLSKHNKTNLTLVQKVIHR